MTEEKRQKEIREAIQAGERALTSLGNAKEQLDSARNWGIFDMMGGGFFTSLVKHSKLDNASSYMEMAKADLQRFKKELRDIPDYEELKVDIGSFLSFADFFFDGLVVDYMVQSRINDTRDKVQMAIRKVEEMLTELRRRK